MNDRSSVVLINVGFVDSVRTVSFPIAVQKCVLRASVSNMECNIRDIFLQARAGNRLNIPYEFCNFLVSVGL